MCACVAKHGVVGCNLSPGLGQDCCTAHPGRKKKQDMGAAGWADTVRAGQLKVSKKKGEVGEGERGRVMDNE